jgi:alginate O-acetyltransferase complex protein AlgI
MTFISLSYFLLFAATLLFLHFTKKPSIQKAGLLFASSIFYGLWDWRFLGLLFGLTLLTFFCTDQMIKAESTKRKFWLTLQIAGSLGTLAFFKYANFFIDSLSVLLKGAGLQTGALDIILPVGISFIVFEVISYSVDVYRGELKSNPSLLDVSLLVAFFPHLVAGPILKPSHFLPQLQSRITITSSNLSAGLQLFLWGVIKKVLVADRLSGTVDSAFAYPGDFHPLALWIAMFCYGLQIYCDFSGYTDMAIGSAKCMGLEIPRNFRLPYLATNITDFWRRWHISLSQWLRDYLYIPLGGSRLGPGRTYINLLIVMLLGGLWHGAAWSFVLWGGLHGVALMVHKFYQSKVSIKPSMPLMLCSWAATLLFVMLAWVPFRAASWPELTQYLTTLFSYPEPSSIRWFSAAPLYALPFLLIADYGSSCWHQEKRLHLTRFSHQLLFFLLMLSVVALGPSSTSPFIYFQF